MRIIVCAFKLYQRGVNQGDPLSPKIHIAKIEEIFQEFLETINTTRAVCATHKFRLLQPTIATNRQFQ